MPAISRASSGDNTCSHSRASADSEVTVLCRTVNGYRIETIVYPPMTGRPERGSRQIMESEAWVWVAEHGIEFVDPDADGTEAPGY